MGRLCQLWALVTIIVMTRVPWAWGIQGIDEQVSPQGANCRAPALYVFGDSTLDGGNNNRLATISRSNYPPYGRDFDTRLATGRFTNGRMTSDWIAEFLGMPVAPPYLSPEAQTYSCQGANFASAGAGIMNRTGRVLGEIISGWQQVELFLEKRNHLVAKLGEEATLLHLRNSLFYLGTGGNDFIHSWIINDTDGTFLPRENFTSLLVTTVGDQLKVLYDAGARKAAVLGVGPVGCAPHFLWLSGTITAHCIETVNQYVSQYNDALRAMLVLFNQQNRGAHFEYRDIMKVVYRLCKFPGEYGFLNGNKACCGAGRYGGAFHCASPLQVCAQPTTHVWWDEYHPSHLANYIIARQIFSGLDPSTTTFSSPPNATYCFLTVEKLASLALTD